MLEPRSGWPARWANEVFRRSLRLASGLKRRLQNRRPRFVFIIAIGRSGSTLLQGLLNAIPGACIRGENGGLALTLFLQDRDMAAQQWPRKPGRDKPTIAWFGVTQWRREAYIRDCWESAYRTIFNFPHKATLIGFKEIRFPYQSKAEMLDYCRFLRALEPNSLIVFNVREASAVAKSGWWPTEDDAITDIQAQKAVLEAVAEEVPQSVLLNYSSYVNDPASLVGPLRTLGLEIDPGTIERVFAVEHSHFGNRFKAARQTERGEPS